MNILHKFTIHNALVLFGFIITSLCYASVSQLLEMCVCVRVCVCVCVSDLR